MFDNLKKQENNIDDIFAETDKAEGLSSINPATLSERPTSSPAGQPLMSKPNVQEGIVNKNSVEDFSDFSDDDDRPKKVLKKIFIIIIILAIIGIAAYFVYAKILAPQALNSNLDPSNSDNLIAGSPAIDVPPAVEIDDDLLDEVNNVVEDDLEIGIIEEENTELEILKNIDTDVDGISDYDEMYVHFTDPFSLDTDGDGLSDYEEVFIIGTDPLNSDTDGDGYFDGQETMSCYNPLGEKEININLFVNPQYFAERFPELMTKCNLSL